MNLKAQTWSSIVALLFALVLTVPAIAADTHQHSMGQNMTDMKFGTFPNLPTCTVGSVQNGDPATGPSIIFAKVKRAALSPGTGTPPTNI